MIYGEQAEKIHVGLASLSFCTLYTLPLGYKEQCKSGLRPCSVDLSYVHRITHCDKPQCSELRRVLHALSYN